MPVQRHRRHHATRWHNPAYWLLGGAVAELAILALWWAPVWVYLGVRWAWRAHRRHRAASMHGP